MKRKMLDLFNKLSKTEKNVMDGNTEILSPSCSDIPVKVRIDGIILTFKALPKNFNGWGVFKVRNQKEVELIREASLTERQRYLELYPRFSAVVYKQDRQPYAVIVRSQYRNTIIDGKIRILLAENINQFDSVNVRWDGHNFWYDSHSTVGSLINSEQLRNNITNKTKLENLKITAITPAQLEAYKLAFEDVKTTTQERLENALKRSGGKLVSYTDRGNSYTVKYIVENNEYTSTVDENLRVEVAGICLSGGDKNFDLQSLVHVIREGEERNRIVVGNYANYGY